MNIFQLVCFLAVAENLSFARAAEQLHITQPAVTQQIRTLEKELGARLFIRTTRSVKLTEEGKSFFIDARQMVEISERAKKRFENPFGTEIATLAIGCSNYPSMFLLSTALRRTAAGRPDFHPRLQLVSFLQIQRAIDDGGLDAVISFREAASMRISAVYEELAKVPLVCICHSEHPLAQRCSVTMDELKNERLVLFTPSRTSPVVADVQSGLMGGRAPSEFYFCDSGEAVVARTRLHHPQIKFLTERFLKIFNKAGADDACIRSAVQHILHDFLLRLFGKGPDKDHPAEKMLRIVSAADYFTERRLKSREVVGSGSNKRFLLEICNALDIALGSNKENRSLTALGIRVTSAHC